MPSQTRQSDTYLINYLISAAKNTLIAVRYKLLHEDGKREKKTPSLERRIVPLKKNTKQQVKAHVHQITWI